MAPPLALDVSNDNPITEALVRRSGASLLIAKATEGDSFQDTTYQAHRAVAKACGVPFGAYLYLHPLVPGDQAAYFLAYAQLVRGRDLDPIIDCETTDQSDVEHAAARAVACTYNLTRAGWRPYLYSSASFLRQLYAYRPELKQLRVWEAQYPGRYTAWSPSLAALRYRFRNGVTVALWQWTDVYPDAGHRYDASAILAPLASLISQPPT